MVEDISSTGLAQERAALIWQPHEVFNLLHIWLLRTYEMAEKSVNCLVNCTLKCTYYVLNLQTSLELRHCMFNEHIVTLWYLSTNWSTSLNVKNLSVNWLSGHSALRTQTKFIYVCFFALEENVVTLSVRQITLIDRSPWRIIQ